MPKSGVEYATDQITVYRYCPYMCLYCYVWRNKLFASRVQRGRYDPVKEALKYSRRAGRTIVVSFVSDPYPPEEREKMLTRRVLEVLAKTRNRVMILTKNPILALRDLDIMRRGDVWLGTTITTLHEWRKYEPKVPSPYERMDALRRAHEEGIKTWISIEPLLPQPDPSLILKLTAGYTDYYVVGALNYRLLGFTKRQLREFYNRYVPRMIAMLEEWGKPCTIKKELKAYLGGDL